MADISQPSVIGHPPRYDLARLSELRDRHQHLLQDYRRASAAVQEAAKHLSWLRMDSATHPAAADVLCQPSEKLGKLSNQQLKELLISPRAVQQIQAAEKRLTRLTAEREKLQSEVANSSKFTAQLEAFAKANHL